MEARQFVYIILHFLAVFSTTGAEDSCQTPDHHQGLCKSIAECPSMSKLLRQIAKKRDQDVTDYLRKSHCGFNGIYPKVCCSNDATDLTNYAGNADLLPDNSVCGHFVEDRIYRAEQTSIGEYPWTAWLRYNSAGDRKQIYCGGVLISERYVLTAAHCIKGPSLPKNSKVTSVRLKEHDLGTNPDCEEIADQQECSDPFLDVPIEETVVHEDYSSGDPNQYHDIALLRLEKAVVFNDFLEPICLFRTVQSDPKRAKYVTAGWGIDVHQVRYTAKKKNFVLAKDAAVCEAAFKVKLSQNQVCIGAKRFTNWCSRDSGGSLMSEPYRHAAGVMSFGSCNSEGQLAVYTRVDRYKNWIISNLKP